MKNYALFIMLLFVMACIPKPLVFEKAIYSEKDNDLNYEIVIEYPKFKGPGANEVNEEIFSGINMQIDKFKDLVNEMKPAGPSTLEGNFSVRFNDYPFLSTENRFEMAVPGTSVILREYANVNFDRSKIKNYDSARAISKDKAAEMKLQSIVMQKWRAGNEDLPCEFSDDTSIDYFTFNGEVFLFYVNLYSGNPLCQWQTIRIDDKEIIDLLHPDLKSFLSLKNENPAS